MPDHQHGVADSSLVDTPVGTAETLLIASPSVRAVRAGQKVLVIAWFQITTGGAQTSTTARIRRGSGVGGTLISDALLQVIYAAAGSTEDHVLMVIDNAATDDPLYSLTIATAGAAGTATQFGIVVIQIG